MILVKYNSTASLYTVLLEAGTRNAKANPTLAAGDVTISKDGGAFANLATLPDVQPAAGVQVRIQLSATEAQCGVATIKFKDQTSPAEWDEQYVQIFTYGNASAFMVFDFSQATPNVNVSTISNDAITAASIADSATGEIVDKVFDEPAGDHVGTGTTGAQIKTVIDAINAKTTNLPSDPADESALEAALASTQSAIQSDISDLETDISALQSDVDGITAKLPAGGDIMPGEQQVLSIQNNTNFSSSPPSPILIPESGNKIFKISCGIFDESGNPEDPDTQDGGPQIAILGRAVNGQTNKTAFFDDEAGTTPATASVAYANHLKMVKVSTGRFETYYKIPYTEVEDNWQFTYKYKENAVEFIRDRSIVITLTNPDAVTLADNNTNADIVAKALKARDVSSTGAVSGSVYDDVMDNIDAVEGKVDIIDTVVDAIDTRLPSDPADQSAVEAAISASETNVIAEIDENEVKIDAVKIVVDAIDSRLPSDPADQSLVEVAISASEATIVTDLDDIKGTGFVKDTDSLVQLSHQAGTKGTDNINDKIGTPVNIDGGGATLSDNLKKFADDAGGTEFDATKHSMKVNSLKDSSLAELSANTALPQNPTKEQALMAPYMAYKNEITQTEAMQTFKNNAGNPTHKKAITNVSGTLTYGASQAGGT